MDRVENALVDIARRFGVSAIYAFGSRAREIAARREGGRLAAGSSDADIGVQPHPERPLSAQERVQLMAAFEDLLHVGRVDLVVFSEAGPFLALEVIRGELLYCDDPDSQAEQELYILRRAGDLAPYERERRQAILGLAR